MRILFKNWRAEAQGTRRGYVELHLPDVGLIVRDVVVHVFAGSASRKLWVSMPARSFMGAGGETAYAAFLIFAREANEKLQRAANEQLTAVVLGGSLRPVRLFPAPADSREDA